MIDTRMGLKKRITNVPPPPSQPPRNTTKIVTLYFFVLLVRFRNGLVQVGFVYTPFTALEFNSIDFFFSNGISNPPHLEIYSKPYAIPLSTYDID